MSNDVLATRSHVSLFMGLVPVSVGIALMDTDVILGDVESGGHFWDKDKSDEMTILRTLY